MRLNNYNDRNDLLIDWMLEASPKGGRFLDVGANDGSFCPGVSRIRNHAGYLAGVDPDRDKLQRNPFVAERYFSTLEGSDIPSESFEVLCSFYVFEHVEDEDRFIAAAARVLKPGGNFFFITPNGFHYFASIASLFARLGLQREMLGLLRPQELVDAYHYPAVYRLNTPKDIERIGRRHGFLDFEYRYSERYGEIATYFPGPAKVFPWAWEKTIRASGRENLLLNLMGRMTKTV